MVIITASIGAFLRRSKASAAFLDFAFLGDRIVDPFLLRRTHIATCEQGGLCDIAWISSEEVEFRTNEHAVNFTKWHALNSVPRINKHAPAVFVGALKRCPKPARVAIRQLVILKCLLCLHCHSCLNNLLPRQRAQLYLISLHEGYLDSPRPC